MQQLLNNLLNKVITVKDLTTFELNELKSYLSVIICTKHKEEKYFKIKEQIVSELKERETKKVEIEK